MRLRTRFADDLKSRLRASLPAALESLWDLHPVVAAVEQIKFTPEGGMEKHWELTTSIAGIMRVEIRADEIDALEVEPLISNLVAKPIFLNFEPDTPLGQLTERARFVLADWRDVVREAQIASSLRFTVEGDIAAAGERLPLPNAVTTTSEVRP